MPVLVPIPNLEDLGSFIHELENTLRTAPRPIKALLLSNPHNPLGRCYSLSQLEACLKFCQKNNIHLITDEVFGPLTFKSPDLPEEERFVSVLELDCEALGCDPSRVHMIWSPSKVFALSGVRLVRSSCVLILLFYIHLTDPFH
jgi:aspartate/methionine/tyrosine aminotransferase